MQEASSSPLPSLHNLPCSLNYTGTAPVSAYFRPTPCGYAVDAADIQEAAFRGRQLKGASLPLPEGYSGQVLQRGLENADPDAPQPWIQQLPFAQLTYWNHDKDPSRTDGLKRSFEWLALASKVHAPVEPTEVAAMVQDKGLEKRAGG
ncbi:hypothetical protein WJX72_007629 [[Myrmecia] bisecta]|uniref:Uncharacterized protein n=1 Tax=[Myrmecia] bisecta TaxID=41462 RepID=A0AAW1PKZ5_9CHLO